MNTQACNLSIIGGNHGYPNQSSRLIKDLSQVCLINARSCLYVIIKQLKPSTVWMPSYLCESLLHPDYPIQFYEIDIRLQIKTDFLEKVSTGDVVLLIDYFGFPFDQEIFDAVRDKGAISIEDASQSFLSQHRNADFIIYSLTKSFGLPDGGMIESEQLSPIILQDPPVDYIESAMTYRLERLMFDIGQDVDWYASYLRHKNKVAPVGYYKMSDTSINAWNNIDHVAMSDIARSNYLLLQSVISPIKNLVDNVVPIGFPIICDHRNDLMKDLIEQKIYPPIHWKLNKVPRQYKDSYHISERQITLPCDHRYNSKHMEQIIECISKTSY